MNRPLGRVALTDLLDVLMSSVLVDRRTAGGKKVARTRLLNDAVKAINGLRDLCENVSSGGPEVRKMNQYRVAIAVEDEIKSFLELE